MFEEVEKLAQEYRRQGKTIALCHGCFDVLHEGHRELFRRAKEAADVLFVGVDADEYLRIAKGEGRPHHTLNQRLESVLREIPTPSHVFVIPVTGKVVVRIGKLYEAVRPNFLFTGQDENLEDKRKRAETFNIEVRLSPQLNSSTQIIKKLKQLQSEGTPVGE